CPTLLAPGLSLLIFRHAFRPVVRDLLLGFCHGNRAFCRNRHRVVILGGWLVVRHVIQLVNLAVMRIKDLLESCRQILEEMKAVGDLRGFWSSLPNTGGIGFGAVAGDNLDVGMGVKPRGHGFSRAIFQHVNATPSLEIDDEGAVALAFAPRPIIYPNDFRFGPPRQRHAAHPSQEGIATAWYTVASQVPSAGTAAEDQARVGLRRGQSRCR